MFKINKKHFIHVVLGHSYLFYFVLFAIGIFFDGVKPIQFIHPELAQNVGVFFVFLGSLLMVWSQQSSKKSLHERHEIHRSEKAFFHGPYAYLRNPTQTSLLFMFLGLGLVLNMAFVSIAAVVSFILGRLFFIKKQEAILLDRYGQSYKTYKAKVRF